MSLLGRELSEEELRNLEKLAWSRTEQARYVSRARIVLAASQVRHVCDVVHLEHTDRHTVWRWIHRYLAHGLTGLRDRPRSGAPCTFSCEQRSRVVETAMTSPSSLGLPFASWTRKRLSDYLAEHCDFRMSETHIGELLQKEGLRWKQQESWFSESLDPHFAEKRGPLSSCTSIRPKASSSRA